MKQKLIILSLILGFISFVLSDLVMASALKNPLVDISAIAIPFAFIIGLIVTDILLTIFAADSVTKETYLDRIPDIRIRTNLISIERKNDQL